MAQISFSIDDVKKQAEGFSTQADTLEETIKALDDLLEGNKLVFPEPAYERYKEKYLEIRQSLVQAEELARHMAEIYLIVKKEYERVEGPGIPDRLEDHIF